MNAEEKQALIEWLKPQIDELQNSSDEIPFGLDSDSAMHLNTMRVALNALTAQPVKVDDSMALAFHKALNDGGVGHEDLEEIKVGLEAALCNIPRPAPSADLAELVPMPPEFLSAEQNSQGMFELSEDCMTRLAIALSQQAKGLVIKPGHALVPVEPTKEMRLASRRYVAKTKVTTGPGFYRAMLAAAPSPSE